MKITVNGITAENKCFYINAYSSFDCGAKITFPSGNVVYVYQATAKDVYEIALDFVQNCANPLEAEKDVCRYLESEYVLYYPEEDTITEHNSSEYFKHYSKFEGNFKDF